MITIGTKGIILFHNYKFVSRVGVTSVGLLLIILTSSINILVIYLLVLLAIYLQFDIYP